MFSQGIFYYLIFYIYSGSFKVCQQFKFLNWGTFFFLRRNVKVSNTFSLYQSPWFCPLFAALMVWYPQTTELENLFFNMVIAARRWIENSQVTLFQCSFLWKEHPHSSDNRTQMGKRCIRSPKHWGIFRAHYRVVRRDRWKSSKNEGARAMHIPFEVSLFWLISYCLVLYVCFYNFYYFHFMRNNFIKLNIC